MSLPFRPIAHRIVGNWPKEAATTVRRKLPGLDEAPAPTDAGPALAAFIVSPERALRLVDRGFSMDEIHAIVAPRRTLDRRRQHGQNLTLAESDRVLRLERIVDMADRVFANPEKARRWLRKPNSAMEHAVPVDLLVSESGAAAVEEELHAIDHGMFV